MCGLSLGASRRLIAGTGVIRLHEQDLGTLASRADTLSQGSRNRFVLGVGTGSLSGRTALDQLVALTKKLRAGYPKAPQIPIYFAALGPRMVRAAYENADGVLLNFCSPRYASGVISRGAGTRKDAFQVACYVKLFFAESEAESRRMLANEFASYGAIPQYHMMFEAMGITRTLDSFRDHREVSDRDIGGDIGDFAAQSYPKAAARALGEVQGGRGGLSGGVPLRHGHRRIQARRRAEIARLAEMMPLPDERQLSPSPSDFRDGP